MLDFQRRMGVTTWWYAIGTEQADVIADLEACGYVRVEPEPELIDAMKATLVKQRGGR